MWENVLWMLLRPEMTGCFVRKNILGTKRKAPAGIVVSSKGNFTMATHFMMPGVEPCVKS